MDYISELPDGLFSDILSMLSIKDRLKIDRVSKRWREQKDFRKDLYFSNYSVLGISLEELLQHPTGTDDEYMKRYFDLSLRRDEFVKRVDQFLKIFQGTKIDSFIINFYLDSQVRDTIDQWISFAIARGVERIDLIFDAEFYNTSSSKEDDEEEELYEFRLDLFSESNASTLKNLSLENCRVYYPINFDFTPFKNLRSLELEQVVLHENFITSLLSNCLLLEDLSLTMCEFKSRMPNIESSSLCYLALETCFFPYQDIYQYYAKNLIVIHCIKLTWLFYCGDLAVYYINTPALKRIDCFINAKKLPYALEIFAVLPQLEILALRTRSQLKSLLKLAKPLENLKQLDFIVDMESSQGEEFDLLWLLTILQASPLLQKLSIMFTDPKFFDNQKDIKDLEIFSHEKIKVIEMAGCVGNWYEIEFALNVLKYAHKLEQIVMSPYWRMGSSSAWESDPVWLESGREHIREMLQGETGLGRAKLVLI
ncbi:hypothetical protein RIF29_19268 [Crotalaria pallida]|uniref:F-box domain-containing protein n=1 Tax=Crotalaria pallida TaxID=3830 RepID=A0AAN9I6C7_CROPI